MLSLGRIMIYEHMKRFQRACLILAGEHPHTLQEIWAGHDLIKTCLSSSIYIRNCVILTIFTAFRLNMFQRTCLILDILFNVWCVVKLENLRFGNQAFWRSFFLRRGCRHLGKSFPWPECLLQMWLCSDNHFATTKSGLSCPVEITEK